MNKKEKLEKLRKYQAKVMDRLSSDLPEKHKNRPKSYKSFLENELRLVTSAIEKASQ